MPPVHAAADHPGPAGRPLTPTDAAGGSCDVGGPGGRRALGSPAAAHTSPSPTRAGRAGDAPAARLRLPPVGGGPLTLAGGASCTPTMRPWVQSTGETPLLG
ncbi:hypothetical protein ACH49_19705 [Streptomyces leeuwenhoekii]|uniref:Uncharacterized protein n=1 Tax=Streptomyces leeuwenhoekii TaxID=1437453 RepID=A0ABR5HVK6_STRLW|nr:hypothetical protein ACH49_19705 [Streptomyces leeuwenhoekii]